MKMERKLNKTTDRFGIKQIDNFGAQSQQIEQKYKDGTGIDK